MCLTASLDPNDTQTLGLQLRVHASVVCHYDDGVVDKKARNRGVTNRHLLPSGLLIGTGGGVVMRPFCPDGYVLAQEVILSAALAWFPDEISALMNAAEAESEIKKKPNDDIDALTSVERLAGALALVPSISDGLRQQFRHLLSEIEDRFRNFLHKGAITAFYFGGLFDQGRHVVDRKFWATEEANGVLISGRYWPFGKPGALHKQRPSYPLCFLESELASLLGENPKSPPSDRDPDTLPQGGREALDKSARATSEPQSLSGAKSRGIAEAIDTLWPNQIPKGLERQRPEPGDHQMA